MSILLCAHGPLDAAKIGRDVSLSDAAIMARDHQPLRRKGVAICIAIKLDTHMPRECDKLGIVQRIAIIARLLR